MADRWSCDQRPGSLRADVCAQLIAGERPCAWDHGDWPGCIAQAGLAKRCGRIEPRAQARLAIRLGPHIGLDEGSQVGAIEVQQRDGSVVLLIEGSTIKPSKPCRAI